MRPKKLILYAIIAGVITTILFFIFISQDEPTVVEESVPQATVVAALTALEANQQITAEDIETREIPEDQVHPSAVQNPEDIIGDYTADYIQEGEIILEHRVLNEDDIATKISEELTPGMRAVSIDVDYVESISAQVDPGDYVDVILSRQTPSEFEGLRSEILLEEVKVLSVGQRLTEVQQNAEGEEAAEDYQAVTFELTPEDTVALINANETGELQLALHSRRVPTDEEEEALAEAEEFEEEPVIVTAPVPSSTSGGGGSTQDQTEMLPPTESPEQQTSEPVENTEEEARVEDIYVVSPFTYRANIRKSPRLGAEILDVVDYGARLRFADEIRVDEDDRSWLLVEFENGSRGWISSRIVQLEQE